MTGSFQSLNSAGRKEFADRILQAVENRLGQDAEADFGAIYRSVASDLGIAPDQVLYAIVAGQGRGELKVSVSDAGEQVLARAS